MNPEEIIDELERRVKILEETLDYFLRVTSRSSKLYEITLAAGLAKEEFLVDRARGM